MIFRRSTCEYAALRTVKAMGMMPESQHTHSVHAKLNKYIMVHCQLFVFSSRYSLYFAVRHGGLGQPAKGKLIFAE